MCSRGTSRIFAHVLAIGKLDVEIQFKDGCGEKPSGGSTGLPVVKVTISVRSNLKVEPLTSNRLLLQL